MLPYGLETENGRLVKGVLQLTWQAIGSDVISSCHEAGERLTQDAAVETVIDAQRAEDYARTDAEKAALKEFRLLTWDQQIKTAKKMLGRIA